MNGWLALGLGSAGLIVIPWAAYPWLTMWLAARRPQRMAGGAQGAGLVSVVLATREPPQAVRERLADLLAGRWPANQMELIVAVDGDPTGHHYDDIQPTPFRLVVIGADAPGGKAAALNAGVRAATGNLLIFTDTSQRFLPDAIPHLAAALGDPRFGAVSGALRLGNEAEPSSPIGRYWAMERNLRAAESRLHSTIGVSGSIYAMRRALWKPLPLGLILDDLWVPMRLIIKGHRVGFEPRAVAVDARTTTVGQEFDRKVRTLTGNLQLVAWMPAVLTPWRNPVWLQFLCHKLLRLATPYALLGFLVGVLGQAIAVAPSAGWALLGGGVLAAGAAALDKGRVGMGFRRALRWGLAMQGAIIIATLNGIRGRWDVWSSGPTPVARQMPND